MIKTLSLKVVSTSSESKSVNTKLKSLNHIPLNLIQNEKKLASNRVRLKGVLHTIYDFNCK